MKRFVAVAIIALVVPLAAQAGAPPISGSVQNFTPLDAPRPVPTTPMLARDGDDATLERFDGKFLVLNFWATFCGPCRREMPTLDTLNAKYGDELTVALVSQDRNGFMQTDRFLKRLKIDIPENFIDQGLKLSRAMGVVSLPTTMLIDAEGREVGRIIGYADWDSPEALALIRHYLDAAETDGGAS